MSANIQVPLVRFSKGLPLSCHQRRSLREWCGGLKAVGKYSRTRPADGLALVVVEPHIDDAVFSVGGILERAQAVVRIATVFSDSPSVNPALEVLSGIEDSQKTYLRHCEARAAAEALTVDWLPLCVRSSSAVYESLAAIVPKDGFILLPAGFGGHPDHLCVAEQATRLERVILYEDIAPTTCYARRIDEFWPRFAHLCREHVPVYVAVDSTLVRKLECASLYLSQFQQPAMESLATHARSVALSSEFLHARIGESGRHMERVYVRPEHVNSFLSLIGAHSAGEAGSDPTITLSTCSSGVLHDVFGLRRTSRDLSGYPIAFSTLTRVLSVSLKGSPGGSVPSMLHFPYPTAGGLGNLRVLLMVWACEGLVPGIYEYNGRSNVLTALHLPLPTRVEWLRTTRQPWFLGASVAVLFYGKTGAILKRYGSGFRSLLLLEAGHAAQSLQLALCSEELGAVLIPAEDKEIARRLCPDCIPLAMVLTAPRVCCLGLDDNKPILDRAREHVSSPLVDALTPRTSCVDLGAGVFWVSRCRVPGCDYDATGWAIVDKGNEGGMVLAGDKAISEAMEILAATYACTGSVKARRVLGRHIRVIEHAQVLIDGEHSTTAGRVAQRHRTERDLFVIGKQLLEGADIAAPCDAVLLDRRFLSWRAAATNTGMGCHLDRRKAIEHAILEIYERVLPYEFAVHWKEPRQPVPAGLSSGLRQYGQQVNLKAGALGPVGICYAQCEPSHATGAAASLDIGEAMETALGECLAKVICGVGDYLTPPKGGRAFAGGAWSDMVNPLKENGIELAVFDLSVLPEICPHPSTQNIVRVIAFQRNVKGNDAF